MKITIVKQEPTFKPVELTLVIENQQELDALNKLSRYEVTVSDTIKKKTNSTSAVAEELESILRRIYQILPK